jgi:uncharacterized SAM-binding protein YcdF (DUF218 family)
MHTIIAKKILSRFFFPLPVCIEILLAGLFLLWFTRKQKMGRILVTTGTLLLLLFSYSAFSDHLLRRLERRYPSLGPAKSNGFTVGQPGVPVGWIVILGGGHTADPKVPLSSQLEHSTLVHVVEGFVRYKENPGSKLIVSGGRVNSKLSDAEVMSKVAQAIGIPNRDIILEDQSLDTEDEARLIKPLVQNDAFILVTSASHMPRSIALFESYGMHPIPAPSDYLVRDTDSFTPDSLFPEPGALLKSTRAIYEYLGLAWLKVKGVI